MSLKVGDKVLVRLERGPHPHNHIADVTEAGTVLSMGVEYTSPSDASIRQDGILVKLQISNNRSVFPPTFVKPLLDGAAAAAMMSPPSTRSQRRAAVAAAARVTPSPSLASYEAISGTKTEQHKRTILKDEKNGEKMDFDDTNASAMELSEGEHVRFRVGVAPTSQGKCKHCKDVIQKNLLRVQPTSSSKRSGWYHVACVKEAFSSSWNTATELEGVKDLEAGQQKLLEMQLQDSSDPGLVSVIKKDETHDEKPNVSGDDDDEEEEEDAPLVSLKKSTEKKVTKRGKKAKYKVEKKNEESHVEDDSLLRASDTDSDDLKDMPFRVEYSTTGRATCKGCDERIGKGLLRVAERPLFRGKPGFTVYRHLECTVFSESIERLQNVGGWRRLKKADRELVASRVEESKFLVEKENQELTPDELVQVGFEGEIRPPPKGLSASLLPFQVEGCSWMVHQEKHIPEIRGGILADEMGMGKTLQTITTILDNRPKLQHSKPGAKHPPASSDIEERKHEENLWNDCLEAWKFEMEKCNVPKHLVTQKSGTKGAPLGARAGTLVICPVIALYQWREEIKKFTEDQALTVCCYHGPNRAKEFPRDLLCKYDVVLTTYQVIESDFRKMVSPNKVKCPNCKGSFRIDKLKVHLKYFCGENAQRTEAQARQRRTADRDSSRGGGGGGGRRDTGQGKGNEKPKRRQKGKTKLPMTVNKPKTGKSQGMTKDATKKTIRAKKTKGFDSDSDLSVNDNIDVNSPRPRRSAAASASKKLSASAKEWENNSDGSESEDFQSGEEPSSSDSDGDQRIPDKRVPTTKISMSSNGDSSSSDESADEQALARATKKQRLALARAKATKKDDETMKKSFDKGKKKKPVGKKKKPVGKKKPLPDDPSDSDDSSDDDDDPLDGIDLDKLMREAMQGSKASVLHTMSWWRVVLDEAHMIKSRASQTAAAAFALTSIHRWCLSGTPLQNRVGELYSLIRFLRIDPMAHYFCRKEGCDCKSVHYRMLNGKCQDCGHSSIQHFSHFNKHVLNPLQRAGYQGDGRRAMMKLKSDVLDKCLIRRTKESRAEDMNLPPRVVNIKTVRLHPIEEDFYNALYTQTKSSFDDYVTEGTLLNNYAHIFDLLTKMRQAVDHPYLIVYSKTNAGTFSVPNAPAVANGSIDCAICNEPPTDRVVSSCCGSAFCRSCVVDYMSPSLDNTTENGTQCPSCRAPFSIDLGQECSDIVDDSTLTIAQETGSATAGMPSLKEMSHVSSGSILRRLNLAEFATSTKVEALVQELVQMRQQRPGNKALVFSQFVNMLDLVRWRLHSDPCLQDLGLGVRIIHGGMNVQSRDDALRDFREDSSVRILLMSLKAGGVALNLTVANEAYLLDPWWNPAAEMQAIDRTHRLGQYRPIRAVRFIAEGTVEERVLQLQEKKRLVFDGTVGRDAASLKMLTVEDMKALFA